MWKWWLDPPQKSAGVNELTDPRVKGPAGAAILFLCVYLQRENVFSASYSLDCGKWALQSVCYAIAPNRMNNIDGLDKKIGVANRLIR